MIKPGSHLKYLTGPERRDLFSAYKSGTNKQNTMNALFLLLSDKKYRETGLILAKRYFYNWQTAAQLEDCVNQSILKFFLKHSTSGTKPLTNLDHLDGSFFCTVIWHTKNEGKKYKLQADIHAQQAPEKEDSEKGGEGLEPPMAMPIVQDRYPPPETATIIKQYERIITDLLSDKKDDFCSRKDSPAQCGCVIANYVRTLLEDRIEITPSELKEICGCSERNARNWRDGFREIVRKEFNQYRKTP